MCVCCVWDLQEWLVLGKGILPGYPGETSVQHQVNPGIRLSTYMEHIRNKKAGWMDENGKRKPITATVLEVWITLEP